MMDQLKDYEMAKIDAIKGGGDGNSAEPPPIQSW